MIMMKSTPIKYNFPVLRHSNLTKHIFNSLKIVLHVFLVSISNQLTAYTVRKKEKLSHLFKYAMLYAMKNQNICTPIGSNKHTNQSLQ